jgi:hypothetical protein
MFYALDPSGRRAGAAGADRDATYVCGTCTEAVTLRRGPVLGAHFAHRTASVCPNRSRRRSRTAQTGLFDMAGEAVEVAQWSRRRARR